VAFFTLGHFGLDRRGRHLVLIKRALELRTRLSDTPVLSTGEETVSVPYIGASPWAILRFNVYMVGKLGFGNLRVRKNASSRILVRWAWCAWFTGYVWYFLLLYVLGSTPALRGILGR
jgi:hypothetical protein